MSKKDKTTFKAGVIDGLTELSLGQDTQIELAGDADASLDLANERLAFIAETSIASALAAENNNRLLRCVREDIQEGNERLSNLERLGAAQLIVTGFSAVQLREQTKTLDSALRTMETMVTSLYDIEDGIEDAIDDAVEAIQDELECVQDGIDDLANAIDGLNDSINDANSDAAKRHAELVGQLKYANSDAAKRHAELMNQLKYARQIEASERFESALQLYESGCYAEAAREAQRGINANTSVYGNFLVLGFAAAALGKKQIAIEALSIARLKSAEAGDEKTYDLAIPLLSELLAQAGYFKVLQEGELKRVALGIEKMSVFSVQFDQDGKPIQVRKLLTSNCGEDPPDGRIDVYFRSSDICTSRDVFGMRFFGKFTDFQQACGWMANSFFMELEREPVGNQQKAVIEKAAVEIYLRCSDFLAYLKARQPYTNDRPFLYRRRRKIVEPIYRLIMRGLGLDLPEDVRPIVLTDTFDGRGYLIARKFWPDIS